MMHKFIHSRFVLAITLSAFITAPVSSYAADVPQCSMIKTLLSNNLQLTAQAKETIVNICQEMAQRANERGQTFEEYIAYLQRHPDDPDKLHYVYEMQKNISGSITANGCVALCDTADVIKAIPIIGLIIAAILLAAYFGAGCTYIPGGGNCS